MYRRLIQAAMVATLATVLSSAAIAQPANNAASPPVDTHDDDRDYEWGLLGLFGLLGLWPRKRHDVVDRHGVVDDRRTTAR